MAPTTAGATVGERPFPPGEYPVVVVGSGPGAFQFSHELDQLLKDVPGVQLFRRSDARSGHPTSQGVTLRALGGNASSRALLFSNSCVMAEWTASMVTSEK